MYLTPRTMDTLKDIRDSDEAKLRGHASGCLLTPKAARNYSAELLSIDEILRAAKTAESAPTKSPMPE